MPRLTPQVVWVLGKSHSCSRGEQATRRTCVTLASWIVIAGRARLAAEEPERFDRDIRIWYFSGRRQTILTERAPLTKSEGDSRPAGGIDRVGRKAGGIPAHVYDENAVTLGKWSMEVVGATGDLHSSCIKNAKPAE
ncbi:hypothetical protein DFH07DRAFT_776711 [Mycena maculata]|uniref:Uncharacterized protein n=1 Tax=Mycena maculata TaxID=230809 RepID=A0AAD7IKZ8_9AGAR|nr:hypothetical protein DFH07DRAFT_776711 [Mycena maculata]